MTCEPPIAASGGRLISAPRPLVVFIAARAVGVMGNQVLAVALGYRLYQITHSATDLGLIGLAQFLPALLLVLPAGQAIDRFPRRAVICAALCADILNLSFLLCGSAGVGALYGSAVLTGLSRAFATPAYQALLPSLAPRSDLGRTLALHSVAFRSSMLVGPVIGGAFYSLDGSAAFAAALACTAVGLVTAMALPVERPRRPGGPTSPGSLLAGLRYIGRRQEVLGAMTLDFFGILLGGSAALLPVFAQDVLHVGPFGFGLLRAAPAVGGLLVGCLLVRSRWRRRRCGAVMFLATAAFGVATCGFGLSQNFTLSLIMLAAAGAANMVGTNIRQILVQLDTPDGVRGRVSAVNSIFIGASNQLGQFESGVTAGHFGAASSVLIGGVGTLLVAALGWALFPALGRVDGLQTPPDDHAVEPSRPGLLPRPQLIGAPS